MLALPGFDTSRGLITRAGHNLTFSSVDELDEASSGPQTPSKGSLPRDGMPFRPSHIIPQHLFTASTPPTSRSFVHVIASGDGSKRCGFLTRQRRGYRAGTATAVEVCAIDEPQITSVRSERVEPPAMPLELERAGSRHGRPIEWENKRWAPEIAARRGRAAEEYSGSLGKGRYLALGVEMGANPGASAEDTSARLAITASSTDASFVEGHQADGERASAGLGAKLYVPSGTLESREAGKENCEHTSRDSETSAVMRGGGGKFRGQLVTAHRAVEREEGVAELERHKHSSDEVYGPSNCSDREFQHAESEPVLLAEKDHTSKEMSSAPASQIASSPTTTTSNSPDESTHLIRLDALRTNNSKPARPPVPLSPVLRDMLSRRLYRLAIFHILASRSLRTDELLVSQVRHWIVYGRPRSHDSPSTWSSTRTAKPLTRVTPQGQSARDLAIRMGYAHAGRGKHVELLHRARVWERGELPSMSDVRRAQEMDRMDELSVGSESLDAAMPSVRGREVTLGIAAGETTSSEPSREQRSSIARDPAEGTRAGNKALAQFLREDMRAQRSHQADGAIASLRPPRLGNHARRAQKTPTRSHSSQLSQLLHMIERFRSTGFKPDLVTVNIIVKCFTRGLSSYNTWTPDGLQSRHQLSPWQRAQMGRQVGELLMRTVVVGNSDGQEQSTNSRLDWETHVRPLSKMLIKAYKFTGDLEMARKVFAWRARLRQALASRDTVGSGREAERLGEEEASGREY